MKIQVGSVSVSSTEADLWRAFERCGAVASVNIVTSRATGSRLGFAFVEMEDEGEAREAILTLDGTDLGGRCITGKEARNGLSIPPPRGHWPAGSETGARRVPPDHACRREMQGPSDVAFPQQTPRDLNP